MGESMNPDGMNLDIEGNEIDANIYAHVDAYLGDNTLADATLTVAYSNPEQAAAGTTTEVSYSGTALAALKDETDGRYVVNVPTAAAQMADEIEVTLVVAGETKNHYTTTIVDYCKALAVDATVGEAYNNLGKTMLQYGLAASGMFNYNTSAYDYEKDAYATSLTANEAIFSTSGSTDFDHVVGVAYIATEIPALRLYFDPTYVTEEEAAAIGTVSIAGPLGTTTAPFEKQEINGMTYVCVDIVGINPEHLDDAFTVSAADATITINALKYAQVALASSDTATQDFGAAIFQYNAAAEAVFA